MSNSKKYYRYTCNNRPYAAIAVLRIAVQIILTLAEGLINVGIVSLYFRSSVPPEIRKIFFYFDLFNKQDVEKIHKQN